MKKVIQIKILLAASAFSLMALMPNHTNAQRFNHAGPGGGGRPAAPPPRMETPRPQAPVMRNAPAPRPMAPAPAPPERRTINGGARNIGNHDFHPSEPPHEAPRMDVGRRDRDFRRENVYHTGNYHGYHPYAYHPYHPFNWGPHWHPFGFFLPYLSVNAFRFYLGSQWYYYDDGCYYLPYQGGYSVVPPPIGAVVNYLPDGYETLMVGNQTYYYFAGAFYVYNGQNYQVVPAPLGAIIYQLPSGAVEQNINGEDLLVYNNVYYQPISQDGQDAYEVVQSN